MITYLENDYKGYNSTIFGRADGLTDGQTD